VHLADVACRVSRERIEARFHDLFSANDDPVYKTAQRVLAGEFEWLEEGIVRAQV
jgi:hypothetical protein